MKCKTCAHPQRQAIDLALLARSRTLEDLSRQYGLSISSLHRHKNHLEGKMLRARQRLENSRQQGSLLKLSAFLDHVQRAVQTAETDGNIDKVIRGASVGSRIIHQINRMEVTLELDTVYRLISSPQWVSQDTLLPTDPQVLAGIHQTINDIAFSPCPNPEPENISAAPAESRGSELETPNTSPLETRNSEPETQIPLQELLPNLIAATETAPQTKREKSAKLPKNSSPPHKKYLTYQQDIPREKNLAPKPLPSPSSRPPGADSTDNQKPETENHHLETQPSLIARLHQKFSPELSYEDYLQEKEAALASLTTLSASHGVQPPPPVPLCSPEENPAPPLTTNPCPLAPDPCLSDRFAGYFKFPGDFPPGYLDAVTDGYWPDNPPEHIPDRRWEEDFGNPRKTRGYY